MLTSTSPRPNVTGATYPKPRFTCSTRGTKHWKRIAQKSHDSFATSSPASLHERKGREPGRPPSELCRDVPRAIDVCCCVAGKNAPKSEAAFDAGNRRRKGVTLDPAERRGRILAIM